MFTRKTPILFFFLFAWFTASVTAQHISYNYFYKFEPTYFTKAPELGGLDVPMPDEVRKNGVEGTATASAVLGEDGKTRDIRIIQELPFGVGEALIKGLQKFYFKPASLDGKNVPMTMTVDYTISMQFDEDDKDVNKAKIVEKPTPTYPQKYAADRLKDKVAVGVLFAADGKLTVLGASSTMPKDFDVAAMEAAKRLKFEPATHKKSKKPVTQKMTVIFEFKP